MADGPPLGAADPSASELLPDYHRLRIVFQAVEAAARAETLDDFLELVTRTCLAQTRADACVILLAGDNHELIPRTASARGEGEVVLSESALSRLSSSLATVEDDGHSDPSPALRAIYVPVLRFGELLGALCVGFEAGNDQRLGPSDTRMLEVLAGLVAVIVRLAQLSMVVSGETPMPQPTSLGHVVTVEEKSSRPGGAVRPAKPEVLRAVDSQIERVEHALADLLHEDDSAPPDVQRQRAEWRRRGVRSALRQLKQVTAKLLADNPDGTVWVGDAMFFKLAVDEVARASAQITNVLDQLDTMAERPTAPPDDQVAYLRDWTGDLISWLRRIRDAE